MRWSGLLALNRLQKKGQMALLWFSAILTALNKLQEPGRKNFALKFENGRLDGPSNYRTISLNAEQGKTTGHSILDSNNKELEKGNKINVNQIRSMENRICQTKLTSFLMRLQVWLINFKNVDLIALIYLVFYKALDLVLLI